MHVRGLPWLLLTLLLAGPLAAGTPKRVSWLNSIQQPPDEIPGDKLRFLSVRQAHLDQLIESRKDWEAHREIVRDRWLTYLGPVAQRERPLPAIQVLSTETLDDGIIRQRIAYEVLPGEMIEAYLLIPSKITGRGCCTTHLSPSTCCWLSPMSTRARLQPSDIAWVQKKLSTWQLSISELG